MNIKSNQQFNFNRNHQGFSLLEVTIGLVILGLLLTLFTGIFQLLSETEKEKFERVGIYKVQKALNTFLAVNMFLPCPDTDNDGSENRDADASCTDREGYLPYKDLGINGVDAWGNPYYYRVNQQAENVTYITDVCSSASVMGNGGVKSGADGAGDLRLCPDSNIYYCGGTGSCNSVCSPASCIELDPRTNDQLPPYFHLATPPYGSLAGSYNLQIYPQSDTAYDGSDGDPFGGPLGNGTVAVALSWGANGDQTYRYNDAVNSCVVGTAAELENCDDDRVFVDIKTGEGRDFITWVTVNQAKMALIYNGEFR
ncbi:hypothetical protein THMIRHAM_18180 [Thiomicrorhabdus immobilis]|uniref:Prepilin-type N-terminal cleavage/methylation domain-containing protein n=1 Tax=Thiomicrorhabdus immobilis TaxID=2791037 RepID=A0ABM7MF10_9GAMM|nr:prepilin-type N-terminal cleavage/methylation domain-containing protein [Thiomicrorhabdus immobilis]BCN94033.1 hypothetical protein THMIRHAM_18180 [Thiomicrorhabdus immobilis]